MAEGAVFDLGYRTFEGERRGRSWVMRAVFRDGLRRVLGLRRRTRRKVLPVMLITTAVMPALFFVGMSVIAGQFDASVEFFGHAQYFGLTGTIALIFTALAAGELLVPDRSGGVLAVYASRPLTSDDYLVGRGAALAALVFSFMYLPHLVLFLGRAWVSEAGFLSTVSGNLDTLWQTAAASAVYLLAFAPPALVIAAYSKRASIAAGIFLGSFAISNPIAEALANQGGFRFFSMLALPQHPAYVKDWIMGVDTERWIIEAAGFGPVVSLTVIVGIALVSATALVIRYRRTR
jgi:ABC-2 type transport system permease protein